MARAVHRLDREVTVVLGLDREHVLGELVGVARGLPEREVDELRRLHFLVVAGFEAAAHVVGHGAVERPALGVPEHAADRLFLLMEQVHLAADAAMVALFRFFEHREVGFQVLLARPGGAVDALQHSVVGIAAPVRTRNLHQLEGIAELAGGRQVRAAAEVDERALAVERDRLVFRQVADDLGLVGLAQAFEELDRGVARPDLADDRLVAGDDLAHPRLDLGEVVGGERRFAGEVVIEAVFDRRADGDLGVGIKFLHRLGHHVRRVMAQQIDTVRVLRGDDGDLGIRVQSSGEIPQRAVHPHRERSLGQTRADRAGDIQTRHRAVVGPDRTVRERNRDHHLSFFVSSSEPNEMHTRPGGCQLS